MTLIKVDPFWETLDRVHWCKISEIRTMLLDAYELTCLGSNNKPPYIWHVLEDDSINEVYKKLTSLSLYGDENQFKYLSEEETQEFINWKTDVMESPTDRDFLKMFNQLHLSYQDEHYKYRNLPVGKVW